ncbi:hypothetical protein MUO65_07370 [bacterium]|nr:hypothetical protein [bacterium]
MPFSSQNTYSVFGFFIQNLKRFVNTEFKGISLLLPPFAFSICIKPFSRSISLHFSLRISSSRIPVFSAVNTIGYKCLASDNLQAFNKFGSSSSVKYLTIGGGSFNIFIFLAGLCFASFQSIALLKMVFRQATSRLIVEFETPSSNLLF